MINNYQKSDFFISTFSILLAIIIQGGLLLAMWYFCYYSELNQKPKLITISLADYVVAQEKIEQVEQVQNTEPVIEDPISEPELEPIIEEKLQEPEPVKEEQIPEPEPESEPEPIIEKAIPEPIVETPIPVPEPKKEEPKPKPVKKPKKVKKEEPKLEKKSDPKPDPKPEIKPAENITEQKSVNMPVTPVVPVKVEREEAPVAVVAPKVISAKAAREADKYIARIAKLFERKKKYPELARKKHIQGVVSLKFYIDQNGKVTSCKVINEPNELLAESAYNLITTLNLPKPPKDWEDDRPVIYNIKYSIR